MSAVAGSPGTIGPSRVRYIKLGEGGHWEAECLENGVIRLGFGTAAPECYQLCVAGDWAALTETWLSAGKDQGTATRFTNETRLFFQDDGTTLWITFMRERLYWGMVDGGVPAQPHEDGQGTWRPLVGGWRCTDASGDLLTKDKLSGALTKLAAYRGTSCDVDVATYVTRRINGQRSPEIERAHAAVAEMRASALELMRLLGPKDFELLVDLVFSSSGWRRLGVVGNTQKTLDLDLLLPSTGERAFVQVKSDTNQAELDMYVAAFEEMDEDFQRMFFVHHTGNAACDHPKVTVIGPERVAEMVVDAGLVCWLIRKAS